ncbi:MAG: YceD family protein [Chloroflexota bacterium]
MPNPRRPFRLNVGFIVHEEVGYSHEFPFDFDKVQLADDLTLSQIEGLATIGRTPQGLILQAKFSAQATLECVRCLSQFEYSLQWEMTELYAFNKKSVSESGLLLPEDAHIDLQPLIREYALLERPISPICKPDCRGLCPVCGEDLNQVDCGHQAASQESPFSALKDLLGE